MTPQEIVGHQDFIKIVKFGCKTYNLSRFISIDDLIQEVALHILQYSSFGKIKNVKMSTIILNNCRWAASKWNGGGKKGNTLEYTHKRKNLPAEPSHYDKENNKESNAIEAKETVDQLLSKLRPIERTIFELKLQGVSHREISKKINIHRQNIDRHINNVKHRVYPDFIKDNGECDGYS